MDTVNTEFTNVAIERKEIEKFLLRNGGALAQPVSMIFFSDTTATGTTASRDGNAVLADLNQKQLGLRTIGKSQFLKPVKKAEQADNGDLALQVLATQSGGRVLNSSNDLAGEIATCVADANGYYVLSFEGLAGDGPNEYHALEIKIDKPGLTARTRSGYFAQPLPSLHGTLR